MRQSEMTADLHMPSHALVVGCGGVGSWVAIYGAMLGWPQITLVDADKLEASNLERLPFKIEDVGHYKVNVLANYIRDIRPRCRVNALPIAFPGCLSILTATPSHIWCATDTEASQRGVYDWANNIEAHYTRAGYDGWGVSVHGLPPGGWGENRRVGYAASSIISSAIAASFALVKDTRIAGSILSMARPHSVSSLP